MQTDRSAPRLALAVAVLLCCAALIADRPWYWIAGPEATGTPDPCRAIAEFVAVDPAELAAEPTSVGPLEFLSCAYADEDQKWTVHYRTYHATASSVVRAQRQMSTGPSRTRC